MNPVMARLRSTHPLAPVLAGVLGLFVGITLDRAVASGLPHAPATWGLLAATVGAGVGAFALVRHRRARRSATQ